MDNKAISGPDVLELNARSSESLTAEDSAKMENRAASRPATLDSEQRSTVPEEKTAPSAGGSKQQQ